MTVLFILDDPPYGTERAYNALRLASPGSKSEASAPVAAISKSDSGDYPITVYSF